MASVDIPIYLIMGSSCPDDEWPDDTAYTDSGEAEEACRELNRLDSGIRSWEVVTIQLHRKES